MALIEDALGATRAMHRLLLAAAAVALVFGFSLADIGDKRLLLKDIRRLRSLPLADYKTFVQERISTTVSPAIGKAAKRFEKEFDKQVSDAHLMVFEAASIPAVFREPLHIGRLSFENLILESPEASLNQLDRVLSDLPIQQDVQIVQSAPLDLIPGMIAFLSDGTAGLLGNSVASVNNVQVQLVDEPLSSTDSFLAPRSSEPELILTFALMRQGQSAPIYEGHFRGHVETIAQTSWQYWLDNKAKGKDLYSEEEGRLHWLGNRAISAVDRNKSIKTLEDDLSKSIDEATAKNRKIELPGISVPGSLALFAIPIILIGLASSLLQHLDHLQRLAPDHREMFSQFAWAPLTLSTSWRREMILTAIVAPVLAQICLVLRYDSFDLPAPLVIVVAAGGAFASTFIGGRMLRRIESIRKIMGRDGDPAMLPLPPATDPPGAPPQKG